MTETYCGIDFANRKACHATCWLVDDERTLVADFSTDQVAAPAITAVDCAFGTTRAFAQLLRGEVPATGGTDALKSRATEAWLRKAVSQFRVNSDWQRRPGSDREEYPRPWIFNGSAHVQPTVRLVIVPEFLQWLADQAGTGTADRLHHMQEARLGNGRTVEAHPRMFLYSAVERLRAARGEALQACDLDAVGGYKGNDGESELRRERVYRLLAGDTRWLVRHPRKLEIRSIATLVETDHAFDAWLCALTAWAHRHGETWGWEEVGLDRSVVEVEGHILILRPVDQPEEGQAE